MKTHTSSFKEQIKLIGKEIDSRITFGSTVLGKNDLNAVTPSYQGAILKSVMKQLDIDSNVAIPIGTNLKYEFGLKVNGEYEYINYGNYVVYSIEKQEDTNSYKIVCYDKLLYSMLDYVKLPITYPISIRDYINSISTVLGLKFANKNDTFANYDKQIQADLYDGLGYTFRDVLDELAQVTASTICLNENDELEIRYITETGDTIDEEFLKDVNVNFGEKFGAVNTIVLSRSGDSDSVYYPSVLPANPYEIKISDNQIMNGNDRADFLPDIYNKLNGLEFYTNDFVSTGIIYYDLCDRYSVKIGDNTYSCVMFNDEVLVTQGLEENIYTELPEQTETDYKYASKDDRMINQVYIIAKKNEAEILAVVNTTKQLQKEINPTKDESGSEIIIEDASNNPLIYLEIEGKSIQNGEPTPDTPIEIESLGYENLSEINNITINAYSSNPTVITSYIDTSLLPLTFSFDYDNNENYLAFIRFFDGDKKLLAQNQFTVTGRHLLYTLTSNSSDAKYVAFTFRGSDTNTFPVNITNIQVEKGSIAHSYIPYGKYGIEVKVTNGTDTKTTVLQLNEPLRSLSNGVKDKAYIKNNKLYVDRYIRSVVLNGSEKWEVQWNVEGCRGWRVNIDDLKQITNANDNSNGLSNYFPVYSQNTLYSQKDYGISNRTNQSQIIVKNNKTASVTDFKTWLSSNNVQVDYELATPITEEYGEIEMLKTLKGYNNISTTDDLLPIINLTYVRDTVIADYVENHVTELKLTENEIKARVESVSSSVDGLNTTINRVEEITNDNSQVINVISTNIDRTSGEVREVTTTTGFTFNKDGMTIDDGSGFKAEHRANGTYYKDGSSITGQYTKDGSKQKDLELFGIYSYGKESIDDTPMFIGQLYRDENNEQCFGHFYNGGD